MLIDECKVTASKMAKQGICVQWHMWEAMPHCFPLLLERCGLRAVELFFEKWARFCNEVTGNGGQDVVKAGSTWYEAKTNKEVDIGIEELTTLTDEDVSRLMKKAQEARREGIEGEAKLMPRL